LTFVADHLDRPTIVALTATPPYDVTPFEWQRYEELCGPVDAEVSVPELVWEGDLCPHQDYVYLSLPRPEEPSSCVGSGGLDRAASKTGFIRSSS
jgi:superfamily II DNA or RNA helicase